MTTKASPPLLLVMMSGQVANLEGDVGDLLAQQLQAAPGALMQEAQRHIKGGTPPHLQGSRILHDVRRGCSCLQHVM